ncbi:hypothetical protein I3760_12G006700 [Carya illinoinensis]|nr:hypothetical protein I3760_12G006700 [Carya illinoinensis]
MNEYIWLCERNNIQSIVHSPINGLQDIYSNQILTTSTSQNLHEEDKDSPVAKKRDLQ